MDLPVGVDERGCNNDFVERVAPPSLPLNMSAMAILKRNGVTIHVGRSVDSSFYIVIMKWLMVHQHVACVFQKKKEKIA